MFSGAGRSTFGRQALGRVAKACVFGMLAVAVLAPVAAVADDDDDDKPMPLLVMGDFNRDGIADIAEIPLPKVGDKGPRTLSILLGQKDGSYRATAFSPQLGPAPQSLVVGDFNGDGVSDVLVGDSDGAVLELLGDGKGNLISAGDIARLGSVVSIAIGDFNHDGILDMAVSDSRSNVVAILIGNGKGEFKPTFAFQLANPGKTYQIAAADFNGDGIPDLAITNKDDDTFEVMLNTGSGTFTFSALLSKIRDPNSHCAA